MHSSSAIPVQHRASFFWGQNLEFAQRFQDQQLGLGRGMIIVTHKRLSDTVALGPDNFQGVCFEAEPMQLAGEGQARQIQTVIVVGCKRKYRHVGRAREQEVEIDVFAAKGTSSSLGQERLVGAI